ncbi:MAG: hypothetical protein ACRDPE_09305 [Solirubrobacterales bacterium]
MRATPDPEEIEVSAEVRRRLEDRYRDARWRIWVCAEPDGDKCGSGSLGVGFHRCETGLTYQRGRGPRPEVAFIEVAPVEAAKG